MGCLCSQGQPFHLCLVSSPLTHVSAVVQQLPLSLPHHQFLLLYSSELLPVLFYSYSSLPSTYKHAASFYILSIKKFLRSYIFPQLSLFFSALLDGKTTKMSWYLLHFISFLLYWTFTNREALSWPLITTSLNPMVNSQSSFSFTPWQHLIQLMTPLSWNTFLTWLPQYHSCGFPPFSLVTFSHCSALLISWPFSSDPAYSHQSISCHLSSPL